MTESEYCELCDLEFGPQDVSVDTSFGPLHLECADSHDERDAEDYAARALEAQP